MFKETNFLIRLKLLLIKGLKKANNQVLNEVFFDTIKVKPNASLDEIKSKALAKKINLRYFEDGQHVWKCERDNRL